MFDDINIWVRGAGELGSATAHILHNCGLKVILSELPTPMAIRRQVTFSDAILNGSAIVEGVTAEYCQPTEIESTLLKKNLPLLSDSPKIIQALPIQVVVDARMLKHDIMEKAYGSAYVVGLGPGFTVGNNCNVIIETQRGHNLGKIIRRGSAAPNTGIPGELGGETKKRLVIAPAAGKIEWQVDFGDIVSENELIGTAANEHRITAPLTGIVRGLISPVVAVTKELKIGDIDPRGKTVDVNSISDKARSIGRGVLEAILQFLHRSND
ncbi:MAG: EF2563 family selenium-dependent molybdenum hydroxylase system protein [Candidatus Marinimicrobia bacterium]|nr:EF2563 family selenium-dependent molybdenum hydroxylase system protein [Candidatus Neomarinimicrobiota bacterium]